ncbi:MAG TPA: substrate-binding domain-containing protein [Bacteroidales bacterium]|nr:substrate-binding domain-containing protein [Bacteroidales bacterium]
MSRLNLLLVGFIYLLIISCNNNKQDKNSTITEVNDNQKNSTKKEINVIVQNDLYKIVSIWTNYFSKKHTDIKLIIQNGNSFLDQNDNYNTVLITTANIKNNNLWHTKIAKDIVVPIINSDNPYIQKIALYGIKPDKLYSLLYKGDITLWSDLLDAKKSKEPVAIYRLSDYASLTQAFNNYFKETNLVMKGKILNDENEILLAVKNNQLALSFCSFNLAYLTGNKYRTQDIYILPIDQNANGILDDKELIYDEKSILMNAYKKGDYPSELTKYVYLYVKQQQLNNQSVITFIKWILSEGQNYVEQQGLLPMDIKETRKIIESLD